MIADRLLSTKAESREAWLAARKANGITASEMAAAAGLDPYMSPVQLVMTKRGEIEPKDISGKQAVLFGLFSEHVINPMYEMRTGAKLHQVHALLKHPDHPILATLDRRRVGTDNGKRVIVEMKTAGFESHGRISEEWGEDGSDEVPTRHFLQAQTQLLVTGYDRCDVTALIGGLGLRIYPIARDERTINSIIEIAHETWRYVQSGDLPPVRDMDDLRLLFPRHVDRPVEADQDTAAAAIALAEARKRRSELDADIKALEFQIGNFMRDADTLTAYGDPIITWREQTRKSYTVAESSFRVMRIKEQKKK